MAATAETIRRGSTTPSPRPTAPLPNIDPLRLVMLSVGRAQAGPPTMVAVQVPDVARRTSGPFVHSVGEDGQHIVRDILGAVYGVGGSPEEAREDYFDMLESHLRYLRANLTRLDKSYERELAALQRLFGR